MPSESRCPLSEKADELQDDRFFLLAWLTSAVLHVGILLSLALHSSLSLLPYGDLAAPLEFALESTTSEQPQLELEPVVALRDPLAGPVPKLVSDEPLPVLPDEVFDVDVMNAFPVQGELGHGNLLGALGGMGRGDSAENESVGEPGDGQTGKGARGPYVRTRVFGIQGYGSRFVYAFDRSGSMEGPPLMAAKSQLLASLEDLKSTHRFQILFFNHEVEPFAASRGLGRLSSAGKAAKYKAGVYVTNIEAGGGTNRIAVLREALRLRPNTIFFLTDAEGEEDLTEITRLNTKGHKRIASIHVIEFGAGPRAYEHSNFLKRFALENKGKYTYIDTNRLDRWMAP